MLIFFFFCFYSKILVVMFKPINTIESAYALAFTNDI